jgi:hypothetical protein
MSNLPEVLAVPPYIRAIVDVLAEHPSASTGGAADGARGPLSRLPSGGESLWLGLRVSAEAGRLDRHDAGADHVERMELAQSVSYRVARGMQAC